MRACITSSGRRQPTAAATGTVSSRGRQTPESVGDPHDRPERAEKRRATAVRIGRHEPSHHRRSRCTSKFAGDFPGAHSSLPCHSGSGSRTDSGISGTRFGREGGSIGLACAGGVSNVGAGGGLYVPGSGVGGMTIPGCRVCRKIGGRSISGGSAAGKSAGGESAGVETPGPMLTGPGQQVTSQRTRGRAHPVSDAARTTIVRNRPMNPSPPLRRKGS